MRPARDDGRVALTHATRRCGLDRMTRRSNGNPCLGQFLDPDGATGALAGLLAHGSKLGARPSRIDAWASFQWLPSLPDDICLSLAAYSCRDSRGFRDEPGTTFPFQSLAGHQRNR